jgi:uncharacterized membrane protein YccC
VNGTQAAKAPAISVPRRFIFALANTGAVLVALSIAFARDLERPYWAMFTVFIIAKPALGAVRSKAAYRLAGTLIGASMAVFLIPPLVQSPVLLSVVLSLWVGACLFLSLLDRTPRSYVLLLGGYTAAIIGFSVVSQAESVFDTAVSRAEEISLGILCGSIAHSIIFPRNVLRDIMNRIDVALEGCGRWISEFLSASLQAKTPDVSSASRQLTTIVTALHLQYTHVAFESSDTPRSGRVMRLLQQRVTLLLPAATELTSAVRALHAQGVLQQSIVGFLETTSKWAACFMEPQASMPTDLHDELQSALDRNSDQATWQAQLEKAALFRLLQLIDLLVETRMLVSALHRPDTAPPQLEDRTRWPDPGKQALTSDPALALLSAAAATVSILIACVIWIAAAWPEGGVAAQFAAIGCSLFATLDRPAKPISSAIVGILLALPLAALYVFAIIPRIDGFPSLALVLFPVLMLLSLMQASERLEGAGLVLAIAFSGGLALQSTYRADFAAFINSNSAEVAGLLIAAIINVIFRTIDPVWNAYRIARAARRSVRHLITSPRPIPFAGWTLRMFDRMGLIASRVAIVPPGGPVAPDIDALRDLRVGLNLAILREGIRDGASAIHLSRLLTAVDAFYAGPYDETPGAQRVIYVSSGRRPVSARILSEPIDDALRSLTLEPSVQRSAKLVAAMISLRLDLLSQSAPLWPATSTVPVI